MFEKEITGKPKPPNSHKIEKTSLKKKKVTLIPESRYTELNTQWKLTARQFNGKTKQNKATAKMKTVICKTGKAQQEKQHCVLTVGEQNSL